MSSWKRWIAWVPSGLCDLWLDLNLKSLSQFLLALLFTLSLFCESTPQSQYWFMTLLLNQHDCQVLGKPAEPWVIILQWCIFTYMLHCRDDAFQSGPGSNNGGGKLEESVESIWMFKFARRSRYSLGKGICLDHKPKINWTPGCKKMQKQVIYLIKYLFFRIKIEGQATV